MAHNGSKEGWFVIGALLMSVKLSGLVSYNPKLDLPAKLLII